MFKGETLVLSREKQLVSMIGKGELDQVGEVSRFVREFISFGIGVKGHSLLVLGFAKIFVTGFEALEGRGQSALLDVLSANATGIAQGTFGDAKQQLVALIEIGKAARSQGCLTVSNG
jgi:hypothetical protein